MNRKGEPETMTMNVMTAQKTYATVENATKALAKAIAIEGLTLDDVRWFVGVSATQPGRFVPTVLLVQPKMVGGTAAHLIHSGIMVVG